MKEPELKISSSNTWTSPAQSSNYRN